MYFFDSLNAAFHRAAEKLYVYVLSTNLRDDTVYFTARYSRSVCKRMVGSPVPLIRCYLSIVEIPLFFHDRKLGTVRSSKSGLKGNLWKLSTPILSFIGDNKFNT